MSDDDDSYDPDVDDPFDVPDECPRENTVEEIASESVALGLVESGALGLAEELVKVLNSIRLFLPLATATRLDSLRDKVAAARAAEDAKKPAGG